MRFGKVPPEITALSGAAVKAYVALASYANDDGDAWPNWKTLADTAHLSRTQLYRGLAELSDTGWIIRVDTSFYHIFPTGGNDFPTGGNEFSHGRESIFPPAGMPIHITDQGTYHRTGEASGSMKITGVRAVPEDEIPTRKPTRSSSGLSTGAAAIQDKRHEKRMSLSPDAEAMARRLEEITGREVGRIGADRERWNELAKRYPGPKGIELVEHAYRDRGKMMFGDWADVAVNSAKVRWYALNMYGVAKKSVKVNLADLLDR